MMIRGKIFGQALQARQCQRALRSSSRSTSTSTGTSPTSEIRPPPLDVSPGSGLAGEATAEKGAARAAAPAAPHVIAPISSWRPSEVHKTSATRRVRSEAQNAKLKSGVARRGPAPVAAAGGTDKTVSPGLRRRKLLAGADDLPWQAIPSLASSTKESLTGAAVKTGGVAAAAAAAAEGSARSVVSLSATSRFRARRKLESLAAAGNVEAIEALRVLGWPSPSASPSQPAGDAGGTAGQSTVGGGGLTPLVVLPVLLALVGTGYCVVNDLVPQEWLSWVGGGGSGGGGGDDSGKPTPASGEGEGGDGSYLSPLLRTLSRVAPFVPVASTTATSTSDDSDVVGVGAETVTNEAAGEEGQTSEGEGEGWHLSKWWGGGSPADATPPAEGVKEERPDSLGVGGIESDAGFVLADAAEEGLGGGGEGSRHDEAGEQRHQPRWLRWRSSSPAPPSSQG